METLNYDITSLLADNFLEHRDSLALFCTSKKFYTFGKTIRIILDKKCSWNYCIENGRLAGCIFIFESDLINSKWEIRNRIVDILRRNRLEILKWFLNAYGKTHLLSAGIEYHEQYIYGCVDINCKKYYIEWCHQNDIDSKFHYKNDLVFRYCCNDGDLENAKWLIQFGEKINSPVNIYGTSGYYDCLGNSFKILCEKGHLEMAKWLYQRSVKDGTPFEIYSAFEYAFLYGQLDVMKWLISLVNDTNEIKKNIDFEKFFETTCSYGNVNIAKWMIDICNEFGCPIDIHNHNEKYFKIACKNNNLKMIKLLVDYGESIGSPIDIYKCYDKLLRMSFNYNMYDMYMYLIELNNRYQKRNSIMSGLMTTVHTIDYTLRTGLITKWYHWL